MYASLDTNQWSTSGAMPQKMSDLSPLCESSKLFSWPSRHSDRMRKAFKAYGRPASAPHAGASKTKRKVVAAEKSQTMPPVFEPETTRMMAELQAMHACSQPTLTIAEKSSELRSPLGNWFNK